MDEEIRKILDEDKRQHLYALWGRAKEGKFDGLTDEEERFARIMLDHRDEFYNQFEYAGLAYDQENESDTEYDPFLHVGIHSAVEAQLEQRDPAEAYQFYTAVRNKKYTHHDAVHFIGQILIYLIFDVIEDETSFDLETYRKLLKKYKSRNPEKLMDLLENDPLLSD